MNVCTSAVKTWFFYNNHSNLSDATLFSSSIHSHEVGIGRVSSLDCFNDRGRHAHSPFDGGL